MQLAAEVLLLLLLLLLWDLPGCISQTDPVAAATSRRLHADRHLLGDGGCKLRFCGALAAAGLQQGQQLPQLLLQRDGCSLLPAAEANGCSLKGRLGAAQQPRRLQRSPQLCLASRGIAGGSGQVALGLPLPLLQQLPGPLRLWRTEHRFPGGQRGYGLPLT